MALSGIRDQYMADHHVGPKRPHKHKHLTSCFQGPLYQKSCCVGSLCTMYHMPCMYYILYTIYTMYMVFWGSELFRTPRDGPEALKAARAALPAGRKLTVQQRNPKNRSCWSTMYVNGVVLLCFVWHCCALLCFVWSVLFRFAVFYVVLL